jgi:hypothetical protein
VEPQEDALLSLGCKVALLQLPRNVHQHLAAPDPQVAYSRLDSSEQLPWHLGGTSGLHEVVDVDCSQEGIWPELLVEARID